MSGKLIIRDMEEKDREQVLALEDLFYHSDAVCHPCGGGALTRR